MHNSDKITLYGDMTNDYGERKVKKTLPIALLLFAFAVPLVRADIPVELVSQWGVSCNAVAVSGNRAYMGMGTSLLILDISQPSNPRQLGQVVLPDIYGVQGVAVSGNYAYVADYDAGLQIIDVSNPSAPVCVGGYNTSGIARCVVVSGNYAYVADGSAGLQIIDISNPVTPVRVGGYNTRDYAKDVAVLNHYAYIADGSGLQIIDISNSAAPVPMGGCYDFISGYICGVAVSGNHAYLSFGNTVFWVPSGLAVIDITNPTSPVCVGGYTTNSYARDVAVSGNYAYVADDSAGLQIIDVSNPALPARVGGYDTSGYAVGIAVSGNYIYVADAGYAGGLVILQVGLPPADPPEPNIPPKGEPIEPNEPGKNKLIVLVHGWVPPVDFGWITREKETEWPIEMSNALWDMIHSGQIDSSWTVLPWGWYDRALQYSPDLALVEGIEQGKLLADRIADPNNPNKWQHVHLIAHSAGSAVIATAANELIYLRAKGKFNGDIHLTFLDAYTPLGEERFHGMTLDFDRDWADNYYTVDNTCFWWKPTTCTDLPGWTSKPFRYAYNVNISRVDPGVNDHDFPHEWYHATITGHYPEPNSRPLGDDNLHNGLRYGFPRGLEAGASNWQERLGLPVGNNPVVIGESSEQKILENVKSVSKKTQTFIDSYIVPSITGIKNILSDGIRLFTDSPVWVHTLVDMPEGTNYVRFTYQFNGTGDGYLTAYFNENLILIGDQRFDSNQPHDSGKIMVGDLMQDYNWLTFRLDPIGQEQASISISNIEIGTITNQTDLNDDLIVNFIDFAAFANKWSAQDCNESNGWCQGCDFDQSGAVDVNDMAIFAANWLWKPPKHIKTDLNFSGAVDFVDFSFLANEWLKDCNSPDWCYGCDFDKSGVVDITDLLEFATHWLEGI